MPYGQRVPKDRTSYEQGVSTEKDEVCFHRVRNWWMPYDVVKPTKESGYRTSYVLVKLITVV